MITIAYVEAWSDGEMKMKYNEMKQNGRAGLDAGMTCWLEGSKLTLLLLLYIQPPRLFQEKKRL